MSQRARENGIWNLKDGKTAMTLGSHRASCAFSPFGKSSLLAVQPAETFDAAHRVLLPSGTRQVIHRLPSFSHAGLS